MVAVFREVWRVLRDDGTLWLNLGDSYANDDKWGGSTGGKHTAALHGEPIGRSRRSTGLKPKDLVGIPWRVAFALQADGWYLRSDVIWHKPNPMPESVTDRPTKAHEYIFLLTKSARYFYDANAVAEESRCATWPNVGRSQDAARAVISGGPNMGARENATTRNRRSVWTIATQPYSGAHFATFPPKLIEPCILAGTSARGCCPACGAPWERVVEKVSDSLPVSERHGRTSHNGQPPQISGNYWTGPTTKATDDWRPTCVCPPADPVPCTVLDPFNGAGTSGVVSGAHGRNYIGIELNPEYLAMADARIGEVCRVGNKEWATMKDDSTHDHLPLFRQLSESL
jgi:DNA modification methylase